MIWTRMLGYITGTVDQELLLRRTNIWLRKTESSPRPIKGPALRDERLPADLHVLYLIFNEGYASSIGPELQRLDLAREAIRLARNTKTLLPDNPEVAGLLALMLLTEARRAARTGFP